MNMFGIPLRYVLRHPVVALVDLAADPLEIWTTIHDTHVAEHERRRPQCPYEFNEDWEHQLHQALGVPWPCDAASEFWGPMDPGDQRNGSKGDPAWPGELSILE
jgi:hypothetical protein